MSSPLPFFDRIPLPLPSTVSSRAVAVGRVEEVRSERKLQRDEDDDETVALGSSSRFTQMKKTRAVNSYRGVLKLPVWPEAHHSSLLPARYNSGVYLCKSNRLY